MMKKYKWQLLIIFICIGIVGVLYLNRDEKQTNQPGTNSTEGGSYNYTEALVGQFGRLNPVLDFGNPADRDIDRLIFSRLVRFDSLGQPVPDLAAVWAITIDGLTYTIQLQPDVTWHDGTKLTAEDVEFTVELLKQGGEGIPADLQAFWENIEVVVLSDNTMQFVLPEPFAPFLDYLSFGVVPKHLLDGMDTAGLQNSDFNIHPIGSGPFAFDSLITNGDQITGVTLKKNPNYYSTPANLEQITFLYQPTSAAAMDAYRAGRVQGISQVTMDVLDKALKEKNLNLYTSRLPQLSMVMFNLNASSVPFLQEPIVRHALYSAINKQRIVSDIWNGQVIPADSPIFPGTWAYIGNPYPVYFDPELAKRELTEAGYTLSIEGSLIRADEDGLVMSFTLLYPDTEKHKLVAEEIQRDWSAINVQVNLEPVSYEELINDRLTNRDYEAALIDLDLSDYPDPDPYPFWDTVQATDGQNYSQWDQKVASEYLEEARVTVRQEDRMKFYRNFQVIFAEELPALPLYFPVYSFAIDNHIRGVEIGPLLNTSDRFSNVVEWYAAGQTPIATATPAVEVNP